MAVTAPGGNGEQGTGDRLRRTRQDSACAQDDVHASRDYEREKDILFAMVPYRRVHHVL